MVTEGGAHVVVNLEPVWHVNVEAFFLEDGVPAIGSSASAAADDLVNAFLVDGSVAFLKGRRPRTGKGGLPREAESELALLAKLSPLHKASLLTGHPHPHPTQASAQGFIFPSSRKGLEGMGQEMGQSKGLQKIEKAQGLLGWGEGWAEGRMYKGLRASLSHFFISR